MKRPSNKVLMIAALCAVVVGAFSLSAAMVSRLPLFTVRYIVLNPGIPGETGVDCSYLKGRNIFDVDLQEESLRISQRYPSFKKITLVRVLPDRIGVDCATRRPLAKIKLGRMYLLSSDLVFFEQPRGSDEPALPLIIGLEKKIPTPVLGRRYAYRDLLIAVEIIRGVRIHQGLKEYQVQKVDVANLDDISFYIEKSVEPAQVLAVSSAIAATVEPIEVKISQENLRTKVKLLSDLFQQLRSATDTIKYVDLRFSDPVIKLKEATEK